jgi:hypothetical protein
MNRKVYSEDGYNHNNNNSSSDGDGNKRNVISTPHFTSTAELAKMQHLLYDNIDGVQFCIDGAIGLPESCTATRVTVRLIDAGWNQVGENSASSFSHPDCTVYEPNYDLHMSWRGSYLPPTGTLMCRVDTLERPSLETRCVGFACLKMFVDSNGNQPSIETPG